MASGVSYYWSPVCRDQVLLTMVFWRSFFNLPMYHDSGFEGALEFTFYSPLTPLPPLIPLLPPFPSVCPSTPLAPPLPPSHTSFSSSQLYSWWVIFLFHKLKYWTVNNIVMSSVFGLLNHVQELNLEVCYCCWGYPHHHVAWEHAHHVAGEHATVFMFLMWARHIHCFTACTQ